MRGAALLLVIAGCGRIGFERAADDAAAGDAATGDAPPGSGPWGPAQLVSIATGGTDDDPTLTQDLLELYFDRDGDIVVATRSSIGSGWSAPAAVPGLDTAANETTPELRGDDEMYFSSDRAGALGATDVWRTVRASRSSPWQAATRVAELSSTAADNGAAAMVDGLRIVFDSARAGGEHLFESTRPSVGSGWGVPVEISELGLGGLEGAPFLSADGLTIYFDSNHEGQAKIYIATRATRTTPFGVPSALDEIDTTSTEEDPWVSADGHVLFFTSYRTGPGRLYSSSR